MLVFNLFGLVLIVAIAWWFWFYPKKAGVVVENDVLKIRVADGVYQPSRIVAKSNSDLTIEFLREDASPCAEIVQFPSLGLSESLPLKKAKAIYLKNLQKGNYDFQCQMQMYKGELIVE
jgi:plastocyanin domain-containing protein